MKRFILSLIALCLLTISADAAARFAVCTTTCTWDNSSTAMWATSSGGATGASAPVAADTVTLDAATCVGGTTCTITVNANLSIGSLTMGACTASTAGCILDFSVNNNTILTGGVTNNGTGLRTLRQGSGAWTVSGTGAATWDFTTTTNLTLTPGTSVTTFTGAATSTRSFISGGTITYGTLVVNGNSTGGAFFFNTSGVPTISSLTVSGINNVLFGGNITITTLAISGTSSNLVYFANNSGPSSPATISVASGTPTIAFAAFRGLTFAGGATFIANNSFNLGTTSGITINAPSGSGGCIIGGWLLWRDLPEHINDNFPAWIEKAA